MADEEILTEHFLVVRVKHTAEDDAKRVTPMALARRALHDASQNYDINLTDMVLAAGKERDYIGRPVLRDYLMVKALVDRTMEDWKAAVAKVRPRTHSPVTGKPLPQRDPKEKAKSAHRARARRALLVVRDYEETYGEKLKGN